jgi:hypothetical protein
MDTASVKIKVLEPQAEDEFIEVSMKKQKQNLVEKYKKFRKTSGG